MTTEPWSDYALDAPEPGRVRDLDETRRLLYMATFVSRTDRYALVGTLVNALAHHSAGIDPGEAGTALVSLVEDGNASAHTWAQEQIAKITELLGDG
jgi:hypothetical protein